MQTTSSIQISDARHRFFDSKADYLAYRALFAAATGPGSHLDASHYAAHALLTGRDLYRAFGRNNRGNGQQPYGVLARELQFADIPSNLGDLRTRFRAFLQQSGIISPASLAAIARGEFSFATEGALA